MDVLCIFPENDFSVAIGLRLGEKTQITHVWGIKLFFNNIKSYSQTLRNSQIAFASIGTTQSKVKGNKESYCKIDFDIIYNIAKACKENNVDLILDANNYILSNNSINITNIITDQFNKIKIETNFAKY